MPRITYSVGVIDDLQPSAEGLASRIEQHLEDTRTSSNDPNRYNYQYRVTAYDLASDPLKTLAEVESIGEPLGLVVDYWTKDLPPGETDHAAPCKKFLEACEKWTPFPKTLILVGSVYVDTQQPKWLTDYQAKHKDNVILLPTRGRSPLPCANRLNEWRGKR